jgi:dTDP-4-dehydrorhamnose 3,5-epimerase
MISESPVSIQGVETIPLRVISDDRGAVLHMVRASDRHFQHFGEVYFSEVNPGVIKAWKMHQRMSQRFAVPVGRMKVVVYDDREQSPTRGRLQTFFLGRPGEYKLLILPPRVWYGFQCLGSSPALMANCADMIHDPVECESRPLGDGGIDYEW